ncbi:MAG: hypothetical protein DMD46_07895 [Gemmatimonadetes bacterium]|nr:MAG: hypothetical protein DMD46_07895 [Gemmatimonadota bacterium]
MIVSDEDAGGSLAHGVKVSGVGCRVPGGAKVSGVGCRVSGVGCRVSGARGCAGMVSLAFK